MTSVYYSPLYGHGLHPEVRFPRERYWLVYEELLRRCGDIDLQIKEPRCATRDELLLAHTSAWVDSFLEGQVSDAAVRRIGFRPWLPEFVERTLRITGGTLEALACLGAGARVAGNLAGGTHHAFAGHGEGFCVFNDLAIAARIAQREYGWHRVLILDLDVHQGNGTASIFSGDRDVFTFSMHAGLNYPFRKERSTFDVDLPDQMEDAAYVAAVSHHLPGIFAVHHPDLVIFQAGVDGLKTDRLGRLALTREGMKQRNSLVLDLCESWQVPLLITMGGGYGVPIETSVQAHADVYEAAARRFGGSSALLPFP